MANLKTIIIDDEPDSIRLIQIQLEQHCREVEVAGTYTSSVKALADIDRIKPDLILLDVEMPVLNGFELLEKIMHLHFCVVFITAYNQYALKAFRFNALDYLLKPIETQSLVEAVKRAEKRIKPTIAQLNFMQKQMRGEIPSKIAIPGQKGISFIDLNDIVYAEASDNYSKLIMTDKRIFTISKTLKDVQDVLEESHFLRIHRQYIINLNHVKHFNRNEGILTMDNADLVPVARNQKDRLIEKYGWL
jgi:two-component system, LytTR family, response regulator